MSLTQETRVFTFTDCVYNHGESISKWKSDAQNDSMVTIYLCFASRSSQILHTRARPHALQNHTSTVLAQRTMRRKFSRSLVVVAFVFVGASSLAFAADLKIEDEPSSSMQPLSSVFREAVPAVSDDRERGVDTGVIAAGDVVTVNLGPNRVDDFDWSETIEDTGRDATVADIVQVDEYMKMFDDPWVMRQPRRAGPLFYDEDDAILVASFDVEPFSPFMMTRQPREIQSMDWHRLFGCACTDLLSLLSLAMTIALFVLLGMYFIFGVDDENECTCCKTCKRFGGATDRSVVYCAVPTEEAIANGKAPSASAKLFVP